MSREQLYIVGYRPFEAARSVSILPPAHPSARLHGHSFVGRVRARVDPPGEQTDAVLDGLTVALAKAIEPLDYSFLNNTLGVPTDENLARYIIRSLPGIDIESVGVQSTHAQGADVDCNEVAHIWKKFRFEAAHRLPNVPNGHPCGRMHGHGFEVVLHAQESVTGRDMGVDFDQLENIWSPIAELLDYRCLNDVAGLENPTSEMIAKWIWNIAKPRLDSLSWVTVYETTTAGCHFDGEHFRIWKQQRFESALRIPQSTNSRNQRLHGHSYLVRLHLTSPLDEVMGWTIDYGDVKEAFRPLYGQLDHQALNEIESLDTPQLGSILKWAKSRMSNVLPQLDRIDLFEQPTRGGSLCWNDSAPALPA